jgi:crossover junction endodeoxyribonuclease RuvC
VENIRFIGIDPSTKTGFVALDAGGQVLRAKELTGVGDEDPRRMVTLINEIVDHVSHGDKIVIEGFPFNTQRAMFAGGLHHGIRKKFVGVTGWTGEKGSKKRLTGPQKKRAVMKSVYEHFGYEHPSDNIVDAYIMARIAQEIWMEQNAFRLLPSYQSEVINSILKGAS